MILSRNKLDEKKITIAVISDTIHYKDEEHALYTMSSVRKQIEEITKRYKKVILCVPYDKSIPGANSSTYSEKKYNLYPIPKGGGRGFKKRIALIGVFFIWFFKMCKVCYLTDCIHIRCPSATGLFALMICNFFNKPTYAMYAGNWNPESKTRFTNKLQKKMLDSGLYAKPVTIYGTWPKQKSHLFSFFSPTFTKEEWQNEEKSIKKKSNYYFNKDYDFDSKLKFLSVGNLDKNKRQDILINLMAEIKNRGLNVEADVIGNGDQIKYYKELCEKLNITDCINFVGTVSLEKVKKYNRAANFSTLFSQTEGYPRVLAEAMLFGAIPIATPVGAVPEMLDYGRRGLIIFDINIQTIADKILDLWSNPNKMAEMILKGYQYTGSVTLDEFGKRVNNYMDTYWDKKQKR